MIEPIKLIIWFRVSSALISIPGDLNSEQRKLGMMIRSGFSSAHARIIERIG